MGWGTFVHNINLPNSGTLVPNRVLFQGETFDKTYNYNQAIAYDNNTYVRALRAGDGGNFEYSTDGTTWLTGGWHPRDAGGTAQSEIGDMAYVDGAWIFFRWDPNNRGWDMRKLTSLTGNYATTISLMTGVVSSGSAYSRGMKKGTDGVLRTAGRRNIDGHALYHTYSGGAVGSSVFDSSDISIDWWTGGVDLDAGWILNGVGGSGGSNPAVATSGGYMAYPFAQRNDVIDTIVGDGDTALMFRSPPDVSTISLAVFASPSGAGTYTEVDLTVPAVGDDYQFGYQSGRFWIVFHPNNPGDGIYYTSSFDGLVWEDWREIELTSSIGLTPQTNPQRNKITVVPGKDDMLIIAIGDNSGDYAAFEVDIA